MKTITKVTLLSSLALFFLTPLFLTAQTDTMGDGLMVVRKIAGNPMEAYSSTLDLNDNRKQLIMAGQNYQTNYGIYASIEIGDSSLGENYKTFKSVEFEIVNYKPTYFIGIDSVVVAPNKMKDGLTFLIYTKAMSDNVSYSLNNEQLKNLHFENGGYIHSKRILNPMFPRFDAAGKPILMNDGRLDALPDNGKAFDFEFFYKDGRHVVRKEDYDKEVISDQKYKGEQVFNMPGKRCVQSFNKVVF
ncbi:hypothetical protein [Maribacter sp. MAR_2009_72]|uniref:hypothetical protein n=1 Tax=Maribacter sp. MAR_2009_72 TaxID=1250050 RepID=UPI00119A7F69|nr:hypothetical protein [Maribacter sp. MAR_2009_72]TVZ16927.1 hypothetical protein JM81_3199 [Maribacter sp. MAR_2009_72]